IVIPPAIFFYYSTLFDSRFKTLQQNRWKYINIQYSCIHSFTAFLILGHEKTTSFRRSQEVVFVP
ncbi:hypothetical protein, partial [Enterococcus faecium]